MYCTHILIKEKANFVKQLTKWYGSVQKPNNTSKRWHPTSPDKVGPNQDLQSVYWSDLLNRWFQCCKLCIHLSHLLNICFSTPKYTHCFIHLMKCEMSLSSWQITGYETLETLLSKFLLNLDRCRFWLFVVAIAWNMGLVCDSNHSHQIQIAQHFLCALMGHRSSLPTQ